jgi:endonuclease G
MKLFATKNLWLLTIVLALTACGKEEQLPDGCPTNTSGLHLAMGNPSNATHDAGNPENYLVELPQFSLSYNRDRGIPNWVSWHLNAQWLGESYRQDDFRAYPDLPSGWYSPNENSYSAEGFDRGHNCPSGDRTCSDDYNSATFYMINMVPQAPLHNREPWRLMESFCRDLVDQGNELYIIMGNYGEGGYGWNGYKKRIDNGRIAVPQSIYKIVVVLPQGDSDLSRVGSSTRVIAVDLQNTNLAEDYNWYDFRTTVDAIEAKTGYDFLSSVPAAVQNALEAKVDNGPVN